MALAATGVPDDTAILLVPPQLIPGSSSGGGPPWLGGQERLTFVDTWTRDPSHALREAIARKIEITAIAFKNGPSGMVLMKSSS
jgi:hypothetical protein